MNKHNLGAREEIHLQNSKVSIECTNVFTADHEQTIFNVLQNFIISLTLLKLFYI